MQWNVLKLSAAVLVMITAGPVRAEVVSKSDAGFVVRSEVDVPVDAATAWAGLVAPGKWWSPEHTWSKDAAGLYLDPQATGCFCELMPLAAGAAEGTRRGSAQHMRVLLSNPGKFMRLSGALGPLQGEAVTATLTISFKPTDKGTQIAWEYVVGGYMRFKVDDIAPAVDGVLAEQLGRLAKYLGAESDFSPADPVKDDEPAGGKGKGPGKSTPKPATTKTPKAP